LKPPSSVGKDSTVRRRRSKPLNPSTLVGGGSVDVAVGLSTLKKWVQQHQDDDLMSRSHEGVEKESRRPCKEPRLLAEEQEVLKKLIIFFAGQSL
jgi:hypothetical protein